MIQVGMIQFSVVQIGAIQNFAPVFSNLRNILTPTIFENSVTTRVIIYRYILSQKHAPVEKIQHPIEAKVEAPLPVTCGKLLLMGPGGFILMTSSLLQPNYHL